MQPSSKNQRHKLIVLRSKALIPNRLTKQTAQTQHYLQQHQSENISSLLQEIESINMNSNEENLGPPRILSRGYTPSPPSTAPLPAKFHGGNRHKLLHNIRSAPNLPSQQQEQPRLKDMWLPVKSSLRTKESSSQSSENSILKIKSRPKSVLLESKELIREFKGRPTGSPAMGHQQQHENCRRPRPRSLIRESKPIIEFKDRPHEAEAPAEVGRVCREQQDSLLEFKLRTSRRRPGYSSTESMATSSSGGSMESLRSSTSEGNRSTSSSESRHSTSLSSHSSDSGSTNCYHHYHHHHHQQSSLSCFLTHHATKLHILSPISDKSSQEPASETSDNNRNNNSQKASPEEPVNQIENTLTTSTNVISNILAMEVTSTNAITPTDTMAKKRRMPQNKNLINLALQSSSFGDAEIQGSDSGISIESRAGFKCKASGLYPLTKPVQHQQQQVDNINQLLDNEQELSDLPFDMPKLRRRRLLMQQQDATTSGSTTSVDLKDLPFDMPKLRKKLRCTQSIESSGSQASSSLSVRDFDPLSLLGECFCFNLK